MSLDYLGHNNKSGVNHHEDWSQFLSTSMAALATGDDDAVAEAMEQQQESEELFAQHQQDVMDAAVAVATSPRSLGDSAHQLRKSSPTAASSSNRATLTEMKIDTFGLEPRQQQQQGDDFMLLSGLGKARSDSVSEALTSSTESSPSGAAWRPLGRRVTPQNGSGNSSGGGGGSALTNNQTEHLPVFDMPAFAHPGSDTKKLNHTSSFRDVATSCLSSSGSSLYESSSSDEEPQDTTTSSLPEFHTEEPLPPQAFRMMMRKGSAPAMSIRPSIIDVDPSFAESSLPVLSSLPAHPRSLSIDNSFVSSMAHHAKSPVLGNRKDSQTWQLQDEEFLKTSPRFGALHGDMSSVFGSSGLLSESGDLSNQLSENEPRSRFTKDMRASSVDFTYISSSSRSRSPTNVNPPLPPPPHEPLQRLRAKSFSYSSVYGSSAFSHPPPGHGYNNSNSNSGSMKQQQYAPPPPSHHQPQRQPALHDYHGNMRAYHPSGSPPPVSSPPPSAGVRPPRVTIPSDSPMHQYHPQQHQYGPPQYRRYSSDTFAAVPPYPADMYSQAEQENQARHSNSINNGSGTGSGNGRGIRSYSMENPNFPATRPFRSQSMEGSQLFAAGPPLEYPSMTRTNSAGMGYDWPRGPMDVNGPSPPLPPDSRGSSSHHSHHSSNAGHHFPLPPPEAYYEVEFKRGRLEIFAGNALFTLGDYVKVEADRGEDIGRIVQRSTDLTKLHSGNGSSGNNNEPATSPNDDSGLGRAKRHDVPVKKIIAVANQRERDMLAEQRKEEHEVFEVCKSKVRQRLLPMNVIDAEYQFDRHKLTFFFEADRCVRLFITVLRRLPVGVY